MPITWTAENKYKLLLAITHAKGATPPDWDAVVKLLGPTVTVEACKQQFKKIKNATGKDMDLSSTGTATPDQTPRGKRKAKDAGMSNDVDDEDVLPSTPSKKTPVKAPKAKVVKTEDDAGGLKFDGAADEKMGNLPVKIGEVEADIAV